MPVGGGGDNGGPAAPTSAAPRRATVDGAGGGLLPVPQQAPPEPQHPGGRPHQGECIQQFLLSLLGLVHNAERQTVMYSSTSSSDALQSLLCLCSFAISRPSCSFLHSFSVPSALASSLPAAGHERPRSSGGAYPSLSSLCSFAFFCISPSYSCTPLLLNLLSLLTLFSLFSLSPFSPSYPSSPSSPLSPLPLSLLP